MGQVGRGVHAQEQEVLALGQHIVLDLLRALGRQEQVQAVLAALPRDLGHLPGRDGLECVGRLLWADVVGLVDDEQYRAALLPLPP